jgi:hypothetical protein
VIVLVFILILCLVFTAALIVNAWTMAPDGSKEPWVITIILGIPWAIWLLVMLPEWLSS